MYVYLDKAENSKLTYLRYKMAQLHCNSRAIVK